jgi:hypothetical protein
VPDFITHLEPDGFYGMPVVREASVRTGGHRLGPGGGRIVAEVLIGLIDHDPASARRAGPAWRPIGKLADLLAWASTSSAQ